LFVFSSGCGWKKLSFVLERFSLGFAIAFSNGRLPLLRHVLSGTSGGFPAPDAVGSCGKDLGKFNDIGDVTKKSWIKG